MWVAQPDSAASHLEYVQQVTSAIDAEYDAVRRAAAAVGDHDGEPKRALARLRRQLHRIGSRDYFGAPAGAAAREAVDRLARVEVRQ